MKGISLIVVLIIQITAHRLLAHSAEAACLYPIATFAAAIDTGEPLAIIVNKSNPVESLSLAELRLVFLRERSTWSNGRKITVVMREPGVAERDVTLRTVCRMSESAFSRYTLQATFTGETQGGPKLLATSSGVRKFILNVPGAIGYVRASEVDASVKQIRVDGRFPDEPGYRIRLRAGQQADAGCAIEWNKDDASG